MLLEKQFMKNEIRSILDQTMYRTYNIFNDEIYWTDENRNISKIKIEIRDNCIIITNSKKHPSTKSIASLCGWNSVFEMIREIDTRIKMYW